MISVFAAVFLAGIGLILGAVASDWLQLHDEAAA